MTTAPHGLAWWAVVALSGAALYGLWWLSRLWARLYHWAHRPPPPAAPEAVPARMEAAQGDGVAVGHPEPGRYEKAGAAK